MTPQQFFLSPQGRVSRGHYWLMFLVSAPFIYAASWASGSFEHAWDPPGLYFLLPIVWPGSVVTIKRWHDRNKSGWWILISLIPIIGPIWALVENGFLKGTSGDNRFGSDPLEQKT
jgi:uncharacterized membrane protein YhaH (DUF805 family)